VSPRSLRAPSTIASIVIPATTPREAELLIDLLGQLQAALWQAHGDAILATADDALRADDKPRSDPGDDSPFGPGDVQPAASQPDRWGASCAHTCLATPAPNPNRDRSTDRCSAPGPLLASKTGLLLVSGVADRLIPVTSRRARLPGRYEMWTLSFALPTRRGSKWVSWPPSCCKVLCRG
jgi:hypothetical protein